VVAQQ